jgi:hypothetical protein
VSFYLMRQTWRQQVKETRHRKALENAHRVMDIHHALGKSDSDPIECECCGKKNLMRVFAVNGHIVGSECKNHPGEFPCKSTRHRKEASQ